MEWTKLNFGKHEGKTLPQIMFIDADWFFWGWEKKIFNDKGQLKKEAEELFDSCGLSLSQAFQVFLKQSIRVGGLPFIVRADKKPNPQTLMAMEETEALLKDPKAKKFSSVDELFEELDE